MGLYDMVMVKDNHIAAAGGIEAAVQRTQAYLQERGLDVPVEVMEGGGGGREHCGWWWSRWLSCIYYNY